MEKNEIVVVAAVLQDPQGRILLCRRSPGQSHAGLWEFPGGKQEVGETLQLALERELREELDIEITAGEVLMESSHQKSNVTIHLVALSAELRSGSPVLHVHDRIEWVKPCELLNYDLSVADIPVARKLFTP